MIEVKYTRSGCEGHIEITGHAGYAEPGKDIVCAAVSTLAQTLAASLEKLTPDSVGYDLEPGHMEIYHGTLSERGKYLIKSFFIGVNMVAEQYPDYVKVMLPKLVNYGKITYI